MPRIILMAMIMTLFGCGNSRVDNVNRIEIGMKFNAVLSIMGNPDDGYSIMGTTDVLVYKLGNDAQYEIVGNDAIVNQVLYRKYNTDHSNSDVVVIK